MSVFSGRSSDNGTRKRDRDSRDMTVAELMERHDLIPKRRRLDSISFTRSPLTRTYSDISETYPPASEFSIDDVRSPVDKDNKLIMPPTRPPASASSNGGKACVYEDTDPVIRRGKSLMRSCSMQTLTDDSKPKYHSTSAFYNLKYTRNAFDYAPAPVPPGSEVGGAPFTASPDNIIFFARGNRVHHKNLLNNEEVGQLCKLKGKHGDLKLLSCAGPDHSSKIIAAGTGSHVSLFDIETKKEIIGWNSKHHTFLAWNGPTLTVGARNGTIRSYDTRVRPLSHMKDRLTKSTRHESMITALAWNEPGKLLASGDDKGTVFIWDIRTRAPLEIGEQVQRRRKIQHETSVTSIGWCDYSPKIFATGDSSGILRVWNADPTDSTNVLAPGKIDVKAHIRNLFFSPHAKEILVVKGPKAEGTLDPENGTENSHWNSLTSYSYPSLRHVISSSRVSSSPHRAVGKAVFLHGGTKVLVSVPEEGKIHLWDAYSKPKTLKRQSSFIIR